MSAKAEIAASKGYATLDFGDGRKLERFGGVTLDRPSPAAEGVPRSDPGAWGRADARFRKGRGETGDWDRRGSAFVEQWTVEHSGLTFRIRPNSSGNVGLFPEATLVWDELRSVIRAGGPIRMLNLFAYTGGASLAAAATGAEVVHVDASSTSVNGARENAELCGLSQAPIRWIVEDARKFVEREVRRGNAYEIVLLDPPTWGHGPKGQAWRFEEDLEGLLGNAAALVRPVGGRIILTGHAPGWDARIARRRLVETVAPQSVAARELALQRPDGRALSAGWMATARFADDSSGDSATDEKAPENKGHGR